MENNDDQLRSDLLSKLKGISFRAFLTALSSEMCLEVETMSSKGTCFSWMGFEDWKVYYVSHDESLKLSGIEELIVKSEFSMESLKGTCLYALAEKEMPNDVLKMFSDFAIKKIIPGDEFYCFYNDWEEKYYFFSGEEELREALGQYYSDVDTLWEDMDTDDLTMWWNRYEMEEPIPCSNICSDIE